MQIFIIDDQMVNCQVVSVFCKQWGYKYRIFTDSQKGYEALREIQEPTIAVVDWMMPEMDGIEICTKIRNNNPEFPVYFIILTAKSTIDDMAFSLESGADDYIRKPFKSKELKSRILAGSRIVDLQMNIRRQKEKLEVINDELKHSLAIIQKDEEAGRAIQGKLLPKDNLTINNYHFSYLIRPSLYLSGDFVDYFAPDEDHICFYIADVSGHGASSAFITVLLKSNISSYSKRCNDYLDESLLNPAEILAQTNQLLLNENLDKHLTLFYACIDLKTNKMTYANGGQFPFPLQITENEKEYIIAKSLPVGLISDAGYENRSIDLPDKFCLYLFSDGILEILPQSDLDDQQEYLKSLITSQDTEVKEIDHILTPYLNRSLPDDITILKVYKQ